jgi:hypothetical protein
MKRTKFGSKILRRINLSEQSWYKWTDGIKTDLKNRTGLCDGVNLAQERIQWRSVLTTVKNVRLREMAGSFLTSWVTVSLSIHYAVRAVSVHGFPMPLFDSRYIYGSSVTLVSVLGCNVGPSRSYRPTFRRHGCISLRLNSVYGMESAGSTRRTSRFQREKTVLETQE